MFFVGFILFVIGLVCFWPLAIAGAIFMALGIVGSFGKAVLSLVQCFEVATRPKAPAAPSEAPAGRWRHQGYEPRPSGAVGIFLVIIIAVWLAMHFAGS